MKFKAGDTVRIIADVQALQRRMIYTNTPLTGVAGTVKDIDDGPEHGLPYLVVVPGDQWWFAEEDLQLIPEDTAEQPIRTFETRTKDTNPKDAVGCTKAPLSTIPMGPLYEVGLAMLEGACKYGRHNYRVVGVRASVYVDAAWGHIVSFWEGEDTDPESGIHHLMKAAACLFVARDSMLMGNFNDDRPPKYPDVSGMMRRDPRSKEIIDRIPNPKPPFTEKKDA